MPFPGALHGLYFLAIPQGQPSCSLYHLCSRCLPASSLCLLLSQPEHPSVFTSQCTALIICSLVRETSVTPPLTINSSPNSRGWHLRIFPINSQLFFLGSCPFTAHLYSLLPLNRDTYIFQVQAIFSKSTLTQFPISLSTFWSPPYPWRLSSRVPFSQSLPGIRKHALIQILCCFLISALKHNLYKYYIFVVEKNF